jgi:fumarylacetoacetase
VLFGACQDLGYELELGCVIGRPILRGEVKIAKEADEHIFGVVLLNDWSGMYSIQYPILWSA